MIISISDRLRRAAPAFKAIVVEASVENSPTSPELLAEMDSLEADIRRRFELPDINKRPAIAATRAAYKALGKEPNRYRPACEALCRRIVKQVGLYHIDSLVDLINVLSIESGYSIGGFDADKIDGPALTLGVGEEGEPFEGIGRGTVNICGLPVYRDATGGIGTPTTDHERTKINLNTHRLLMIINIYGEEMSVDATTARARQLLSRYAAAQSIAVSIVE